MVLKLKRKNYLCEVDFFVTNKSNENKLTTRKRRCRVYQDVKRQEEVPLGQPEHLKQLHPDNSEALLPFKLSKAPLPIYTGCNNLKLCYLVIKYVIVQAMSHLMTQLKL